VGVALWAAATGSVAVSVAGALVAGAGLNVALGVWLGVGLAVGLRVGLATVGEAWDTSDAVGLDPQPDAVLTTRTDSSKATSAGAWRRFLSRRGVWLVCFLCCLDGVVFILSSNITSQCKSY
jgi:hypothetical protein